MRPPFPPNVRTGLLATILAIAAAASAGGQSLDLNIGSDRPVYNPGDRLALTVSATNAGQPGLADFYTGLILPDGVTIATLGSGGAVRLGTIGAPADFVPVATSVGLAAPFAVEVDPLFQYVWTGTEPIGSYTIFLAAVRAGSFTDNRIDGGDILALQTGSLSLRRDPELTVEPGEVSVPVTPEEGGTIDLTSASGMAFTLTIPPGAVVEPTTITARAIATAAGLPLDRVIGALRFGPDGLQLNEAATLSLVLPAGVKPLGTVGFVARDDGHAFDTVPVTVANGVATIRVGHFSSAGFGQSVCGPTVTTAVGRDACREMAERLAEAAQIIESGDPGATPLPVRILLASELIAELRRWLTVGVQPLISVDLANGLATGHYLFMVGLREFDAVKAILALIEGLDIGGVVLPEVQDTEDLIPTSMTFLRGEENRECLADRIGYQAWLRRLLELAGESRERNLPVPGDANGITCVVLTLTTELPAVVPAEGAGFRAVGHFAFSDGGLLVDPPVVTVEVIADGQARVSLPTFAQGPGHAVVNTTVAPPVGSTTGFLRFRVRAEVPELGFRKSVLVRRGHSTRLIARNIVFSGTARAGAQTNVRNRTESESLSETVLANDFAAQAITSAGATVDAAAGATIFDLDGVLDVLAEGSSSRGLSSSANGSLRSSLTVDLVGAFMCHIEVTTTSEAESGSPPSLSVTLSRNGVALFQTAVATIANRTCDEGRYQIEAFTIGGVSASPDDDFNNNRHYHVNVTVTPIAQIVTQR